MERLSERCEKHNLAVRPDGTCLLCSGGISEDALPPEPSTRSWRALKIVMASLVILLSFVVGYRAVDPLLRHTLDFGKDVEAEAIRRKWRSYRPKPTATMRTEPSASAVRAARRSVQVTIYVRRDCEFCRHARDYMRATNIQFQERDVDNDAEAAGTLRQLDPNMTVPVIDVDGQILHGFNQFELEARMDHAARQRL